MTPAARDAVADPQPIEGRRTTWFSALAVFFSLVFGFLLFGWIGLFLGWVQSGPDVIHRIHNIGGSGVTTGLLVATPLLVLAWRRDDVALLQLVAVVGVAFAMAAVVATDWVGAAFLPIVAVPVVVLLAIGRGWRGFLRRGTGVAFATLIVSLASALIWVPYAFSMATAQRTGAPNDPHVQMHHWTSMAAMAFAIVLAGVLASSKPPGWQIVAWLAGLGSAVYGVASLVMSDLGGSGLPYPGGEGAGWGILAVAGGVALAAGSTWDARRRTQASSGGVE